MEQSHVSRAGMALKVSAANVFSCGEMLIIMTNKGPTNHVPACKGNRKRVESAEDMTRV
jgi:hypothetical protein